MKRIFSLVLAGLAVLAFSGCSSGGDESEQVTNYINFADTHRIQTIYYECDSGTGGTLDYIDGSFVRDADSDICRFDLHTDLVTGDIYLEDQNYNSMNGLRYTCEKPVGTILEDAMTGPAGFIDNATDYWQCTVYF